VSPPFFLILLAPNSTDDRIDYSAEEIPQNALLPTRHDKTNFDTQN